MWASHFPRRAWMKFAPFCHPLLWPRRVGDSKGPHSDLVQKEEPKREKEAQTDREGK